MLKPGGRAAYLVWGPREETTMFVVFVAAVEAVLGPLDTLDEVDLARPFSLGTTGALAQALINGGLSEVEEREVRFAPRVSADAPFWQAQFDMTFGRALDGAGEARRRALEEAVAAGFERLREGDEIPLGRPRAARHGREAGGLTSTANAFIRNGELTKLNPAAWRWGGRVPRAAPAGGEASVERVRCLQL